MEVIKRDGTTVDFDPSKIIVAIMKACNEVEEDDRITEKQAEEIANRIGKQRRKRLLVEQIQDNVENSILRLGKFNLGKAYVTYRYQRALVRKSNTTDEGILSLIAETNTELIDENSNKNAHIASTQRDLIAGEVSKDITMRLLLPKNIVEAHKEGILHYHDADYFIQPIFNCCLINIKDMLDNGTMMNGKLIESPKGFQVACTVTTQIVAAVASSQYGGQSVNIKHLGKYLKKSEDKFRAELETVEGLSPEQVAEIVKQRLQYELRSGVQTIQYQINTLMTTNGQSPFVTLFLELDPNDEYIEYTAMIIAEILNQRIEGIKNAKGVPITPAFPKLVYVLDECNCLEGGEYDWLTKLAAKCSAKRFYPDYISAKVMREQYEGNVFSCMGCRSFLAPWKDADGNYKFEGRFNQGVVTLNLPMVALDAQGDETKFWNLLDERLELCFEALMCRHRRLLGTKSDISPIHWQYGAIARLKPGEVIDPYLFNGYSSISLGYIGIYEMTKVMKGVSHTDPVGKEFALRVMDRLNAACEKWKVATTIGFSVYSTPAESTCYTLCEKIRKKYGEVKDVTDKGWLTNSYHVDVREPIDAFSKLSIEAEFQAKAKGGAISFIEVPNMQKNLPALETIINFIYHNIRYAEINTKSDYCQNCGFTGEIIVNDDNVWECPNCHCTDRRMLNVTRRTCGRQNRP